MCFVLDLRKTQITIIMYSNGCNSGIEGRIVTNKVSKCAWEYCASFYIIICMIDILLKGVFCAQTHGTLLILKCLAVSIKPMIAGYWNCDLCLLPGADQVAE